MIGAETALVEEWVESVCTATAAITGYVGARVYSELAPPDVAYPFIVYQLQSTSDLYGVGRDRILVDCEVVIRGIARCNTYGPLKLLAAAIDTAFDGVSGVLADGVVIGTRRSRPYTQVEEYEDGQIRHLGGIFRVLAQGN